VKKLRLVFIATSTVITVVLGASACSSDASDELNGGNTQESDDPNGSESPEAKPLTADEIAAAILAGVDPVSLSPGEQPDRASGAEMISPEVAAETTGRIASDGPNSPEVTAQFAAVDAYTDKTVVRYSLRSANGKKQNMQTLQELSASIASDYIDGVALIDDEIENVRLYPLYAQIPDSSATQCLCSIKPFDFTPKDQWFYGIYPPLHSDVENVDIELIGLEPTQVPVNWVHE